MARSSDTAEHLPRGRDRLGGELLGRRDPDRTCTLAPGRRLLADVEEKQLEPVSQFRVQLPDDAGVEEEPGREGIR
jgi:hypothetical protein